MADISAEIAAFKSAVYGEDVRDSMVSLANKLNSSVTTAADTVSSFNERVTNVENASASDINAANVTSGATTGDSFWYNGYIDSSGSFNDPRVVQTRRATNLLLCPQPGTTIYYKAETNHTNISAITFYDSNKNVISTNCNVGPVNEEHTVIVPDNAMFMRLSIDLSKQSFNEVYCKISMGSLTGLSYYINYLTSEISNTAKTSNIEPAIINITHVNNQEDYCDYYRFTKSQPGLAGTNINNINKTSGWRYIPYLFDSERTIFKCSDNYKIQIVHYDKNLSYVSYTQTSMHNYANRYIAPLSYPFGPSGTRKYFLVSYTTLDNTEPSDCDFTFIIKNNNHIDRSNLTKILMNTSQTNVIDKYSLHFYTGETRSGGGEGTIHKYPDPSASAYFSTYSSLEKIDPYSILEYDDDTFNILLSYFDEDDYRTSNYTGFVNPPSPVDLASMNPNRASKAHHVRLEIRRKDSEPITNIDDYSFVIKTYKRFSNSETTTVYVSTSGSDNNDGTKNSPYATVAKALISGATNIKIFGGTYEEFNLPIKDGSIITISNESKDQKVIFRDPNAILSTSEVSVSGYEHVYSFEKEASVSSSQKWIWYEGSPDENTIINDNDRLPQQRGVTYRCEDTCIARCSATVLSDALEEIESSNSYKWFYDSTNHVFYYSRPNAVSENNPICMSFGRTLFNITSNIHGSSLNVYGIESKYLCMNFTNLSHADIADCRVTNVCYAGGFVYDGTMDVIFRRCEAARVHSGLNGDGFNGHSTNTGDPYSKQTTCTLFDCWAHDNNDDGYSDHERSEITIIGGLYEYNGKGGITPSYGSHCTCHNVHSRYNYNGFYYTGQVEVAEGGKYGQMECFNCIAEKNTIMDTSAGFKVDGTGNRMVLINCKSIGNKYGYYSSSNTKAMLIDCGASDSITNDVDGVASNFVSKNTHIVSI